MKIVLLGPPGAGKGTQADYLCESFGLVHLSTGNLLRAAIKNGSDLGKTAASYMDEGHLVPDELVISLVVEKIDQEENILFDGFPRTLEQAIQLELKLKAISSELDIVANLDVSDNVVLNRLSLRRMCPSCSEIYHLEFKKPSSDGSCLKCGTKVTQRVDDEENTINERLRVYRRQTKPLEEFYIKENLLVNFNGDQEADLIFKEITKKIS